jgi:hypothetical protein
MALKITVTDKTTHATTTVTGQELSLSAVSVVELPIGHTQVKSLARQGSDLVVTSFDGQVVVIRGFFNSGQTQTSHNDIAFLDSGGLWLAAWGDLNALPLNTTSNPEAARGGTFTLTYLDSIESLLDSSTTTAPANSNITVASADSNTVTAPADSNTVATPANSNSTTAPASSNTVAASTDSNTGTAPADTRVATMLADAHTSTADMHAAAAAPINSDGASWLPLAFAVGGFATALASSNSSGSDSSSGTKASLLSIGDTSAAESSTTSADQPSSTITLYNGTTVHLTQSYTAAADYQVQYAGDSTAGSAPIKNGVDIIATGPGNDDWVHGIGTDTTGTTALTVEHDAVSGGPGNDFIGIIGTNFTGLDGGGGWNTLVFESSGITLNLTQMGPRVQGFGQFDLNNQSNNAASDPRSLFTGTTEHNTLELSLSDILSEPNGTVGQNTQHMTILGDSSSTVQLDSTSDAASLAAAGWSSTGVQTIGGITFDVWHNSAMNGSTAADLLIQQGVHVV